MLPRGHLHRWPGVGGLYEELSLPPVLAQLLRVQRSFLRLDLLALLRDLIALLAVLALQVLDQAQVRLLGRRLL